MRLSKLHIVHLKYFNERNESETNERRENKTMRDPNTANYYALLIAILCNESAKEALNDMGVCPDNFD